MTGWQSQREHLKRVGGGLESAVNNYNKFVGSFERNVLVLGRRLRDKGIEIGKREIEDVPLVEGAPRYNAADADGVEADYPALSSARMRRSSGFLSFRRLCRRCDPRARLCRSLDYGSQNESRPECAPCAEFAGHHRLARQPCSRSMIPCDRMIDQRELPARASLRSPAFVCPDAMRAEA